MARTPSTDAANPFDDPAGTPAGTETRQRMDSTAVLNVDRNATLTLGTDALIVLDEGLKHRRSPGNLCGLLPQLSKTTRAIPFYNVLWAEALEFEVTIHYAEATGRKGCRVSYINYTVADKGLHQHAKRWVEALMDRAYPAHVQRKPRMKVLVNPFGGQGHAMKWWTREIEPIFAAAHCNIDFEKTGYRGHAVDIAEKLDVEAYDIVACASGDGLPYEVFNGLTKQKHPRRALQKIAVAHLPCGSGNAMSWNLNGTDSPSLAALAIVKGVRSPMDLMAITQGDQLSYSFLSQAVGIVAETDLGTESLRWMGNFRFTWGILVRLLGQNIYPAEISVIGDDGDKRAIRQAYRAALQEHQGATAKQLPSQRSDEGSLESGEDELPTLKYGTVNDPLPPEARTQDHPDLGNFYVGNMCYMTASSPFFPAALPDDGKMDMINISGLVSRLRALKMVSTIEQGKLIDFPEVSYRKVSAYRITPREAPAPGKGKIRAKVARWLGGSSEVKEGLIAIDGERIPFAPFQVEVLPGLATVISKRCGLYEFQMPDA